MAELQADNLWREVLQDVLQNPGQYGIVVPPDAPSTIPATMLFGADETPLQYCPVVKAHTFLGGTYSVWGKSVCICQRFFLGRQKKGCFLWNGCKFATTKKVFWEGVSSLFIFCVPTKKVWGRHVRRPGPEQANNNSGRAREKNGAYASLYFLGSCGGYLKKKFYP